jgi:hypothetical protein
VARTGYMGVARGFCLGKTEGMRPRQVSMRRSEGNIKIAKKWHREARTGLIWLRKGTGDGRVWMR